MKTIKFTELAKKISYDYKKDYDNLKPIFYYTKTRPDKNICSIENLKPKKGSGWEQTFFLKCIAENINCKNFFEIGSGRGTGSLALSLIPTIEKIISLDITDPSKKLNYAIGYKKGLYSLNDLIKKILFEEKEKIDFRIRNKEDNLEYTDFFDLCFIDGNHDNYDIIKNDFLFCLKVMKENAIIIFDDYNDKMPVIIKVVDDIFKKYPEFKGLKIQTRNTIFGDETHNHNDHMVMLTKGEYKFFN